ncbi:MAG: hypothetical protein E7191_08415 [Erysipelotrichaceae bacterium]|nr:hypothetical protein [Erysipelotrichaceae bacterium]MBR3693124.1 alkaline phosphatase family protein [Erysipelotrichales bacterium]
MRTLVILVDGMRPDALVNIPQAQKIMEHSTHTLNARTVMPSVTLPCHMSLFHSVDPARHGTTTNTYAPQVRPIKGLCEVLADHGKSCAMFYNWEELRDLTRPGSLVYSYFCGGKDLGWEYANDEVTRVAIQYLTTHEIDFAFLYLGYVDEAGHAHGWMGQEYMDAMVNSWENIEKVLAVLPEDYTVIITADHGGHDRTHGTEMAEDMTIPMMLLGKEFEANSVIEHVSIKDIAPTITALLEVSPHKEWEGKSLLCRSCVPSNK